MNAINLTDEERVRLSQLFSNFDEGDVIAVPEICSVLEAHLSSEDGREQRRLHDDIEALLEATSVDESYVLRARDVVARVRDRVEA